MPSLSGVQLSSIVSVMLYGIPPISEQRGAFDQLQGLIDRTLRSRGFEEFFKGRGIDTSMGRLVVGREVTYSSKLADLDLGLDHTARRIATAETVGLFESANGARKWTTIEVSTSLMGDELEPSDSSFELDTTQRQTVHDALGLLDCARQSGIVPSLTKTRLRLDRAGD